MNPNLFGPNRLLRSPFFIISTVPQKQKYVLQHFNAQGDIVNDKKQKLEPLKTEKLLSRLRTLEKQCSQLCDLEKPVVVGKEEFMGRVTAKVINLI